MKSKTIVHVNQHKIRNNKKTGANDAPLTIKSNKGNRYAHQANIVDANGNILASIVYRPNKPLSCGARVWIETYNKVVALVEPDDACADVAEMVKIIRGKPKCAQS